MNWALGQKAGSQGAKSVLLILANRANHDGVCWPGFGGIADQTEMSRRSVIRHVNALVGRGLISVKARPNQQSNLYQLNLKGGANLTPAQSVTSDTVTPCSDTVTPQVVTPCHQGSDTVSPEPKRTTNKPKRTQSRADKRFEDFWDVYPRKVKKAESRKKWKLKKLDKIADLLIADVQNRLENDGRWYDGFIPDPTTYLNGERWNDELSALSASHGTSRKPTYAEELATSMDEKGML